MNYAIHEHQNIQVIQIQDLLNELDNHSILADIKKRFSEGKYSCIVDLSEMEYMNSVGLNFLISLVSTAQKNNTYLALANAGEQIIKLLKTTKLYPIFHLTASVEEALQEIEKK